MDVGVVDVELVIRVVEQRKNELQKRTIHVQQVVQVISVLQNSPLRQGEFFAI